MTNELYAPYVTQDLIERGHARRMDKLEEYYAILQRQKLYRNFSLYAELSRSITRSQLLRAIKPIILKFPILAHTIVPKGIPDHEAFYRSDDYYGRKYPLGDYVKVVNKIELNSILINEQREYDDTCDKIIAMFIQADYKYTAEVIETIGTISIPYFHLERPNWRLLCLPNKENESLIGGIVIISNHCLMDGISCVNLFEALIRNVNILEPSEVDNDIIFDYLKDFPKISRLPEPVTDFIDYRPHNRELPKLVVADIIKKYFNYKSDSGPITRIGGSDIQTYHHVLRLPSSQVGAIKAAIKSNTHDACTLTPFLQACFVITLQNYGKVFKKSFREWGFDIAIIKNIRDSLPEDKNVRRSLRYGCNTGASHRSFLISSFAISYQENKKFWSLVEYYNALIKDRPRDFLITPGVLMIDQLAEYLNFDQLITSEYLGKKRGGLLISNLGYHPQSLDLPFHIKDMVFSQTPGSITFAFGMNVCTTNETGMNMDLSVARTVIQDREEWSLFCHEYRKVVNNFTGI